MKIADPGTSGVSGAMTLSTEDTTNGDNGGLTMETDNAVSGTENNVGMGAGSVNNIEYHKDLMMNSNQKLEYIIK